MFSIGFTSLSVILFSSIIHLLHLLCARFWFYFINIDDVLSINPSAYVFVFGDFNKPILMELINLVNSIIIFLSQMTLPRWLTFLLEFQASILMVLLFWIYFFFLRLVFVLQLLFLHWEILIILLSQFPLTFHQIHNRMPHFIHRIAYDYSCADWSLWSFERCSMGGFKLGASAAAGEFCKWV